MTEAPAAAMAAHWCEVAVPVPLPRALAYEVPPAWREAVRPGMRVLVPVGRRRLIGVVTDRAKIGHCALRFK